MVISNDSFGCIQVRFKVGHWLRHLTVKVKFPNTRIWLLIYLQVFVLTYQLFSCHVLQTDHILSILTQDQNQLFEWLNWLRKWKIQKPKIVILEFQNSTFFQCCTLYNGFEFTWLKSLISKHLILQRIRVSILNPRCIEFQTLAVIGSQKILKQQYVHHVLLFSTIPWYCFLSIYKTIEIFQQLKYFFYSLWFYEFEEWLIWSVIVTSLQAKIILIHQNPFLVFIWSFQRLFNERIAVRTDQIGPEIVGTDRNNRNSFVGKKFRTQHKESASIFRVFLACRTIFMIYFEVDLRHLLK